MQIVSYMDYIDAAYPELKGNESSDLKAERTDTRDKMRAKFSQPGGQGSKFKNTYEKMMKTLSLPKGAKDELGITGDQVMEPELEANVQKAQDGDASEDEETKKENQRKAFDKKMLRELYSEGRYHLIPSFFRTLMYLKKQKQEFSIAFRTFGVDLNKVVYEFDKFAHGEHPCFNGRNGMPVVKFDGGKNSKDFRFKCPEEQIAHLYRTGPNVNETILVQSKDHKRVSKEEINHIDTDETTVIRDHLEIYQTILEVLKQHSVMAIQDDYPAYKANNCANS